MRELIRTHGEPSVRDKTTEVRVKVDELKGIMQDNVKRILETHVTLETLGNSSETMNVQANRFLKQSTDLRKQIQMRNFKVKLIAGGCVAALVLYITTIFVDF